MVGIPGDHEGGLVETVLLVLVARVSDELSGTQVRQRCQCLRDRSRIGGCLDRSAHPPPVGSPCLVRLELFGAPGAGDDELRDATRLGVHDRMIPECQPVFGQDFEQGLRQCQDIGIICELRVHDLSDGLELANSQVEGQLIHGWGAGDGGAD